MAVMDLNNWTLSEVRDRFDYNPLTGVFRWKFSPRPGWAGKVAGATLNNGYVAIQVDGHTVLAHRLAWFYIHGVWPTGECDHKNRCRDNNWIDNLRDVTKEINQANANVRSDNTSQHRGVSWNKRENKWVARIQINKRRYCLGYFETLEAAVAARKLRENESSNYL